VVISVIAVLFMLVPIAGSLYPIPPPPFNLLPYLFLLLLLLGAAWLAVLWQRSPQVIDEIGQDLGTVGSQFGSTPHDQSSSV
jgi:hypothetical protein